MLICKQNKHMRNNNKYTHVQKPKTGIENILLVFFARSLVNITNLFSLYIFFTYVLYDYRHNYDEKWLVEITLEMSRRLMKYFVIYFRQNLKKKKKRSYHGKRKEKKLTMLKTNKFWLKSKVCFSNQSSFIGCE